MTPQVIPIPVHHQRPPLTEDAKNLLEKILADEHTKMRSGFRVALELMVANS